MTCLLTVGSEVNALLRPRVDARSKGGTAELARYDHDWSASCKVVLPSTHDRSRRSLRGQDHDRFPPGGIHNRVELDATRKPRPLCRYPGVLPLRRDDRTLAASQSQQPPRNTRNEPGCVSPFGSVFGDEA